MAQTHAAPIQGSANPSEMSPRRQDRRRRGCRDGGHGNEVEQGLDLGHTQATPHVLGRHRHGALAPCVTIASLGASTPPRCGRTPVGAIAPPRPAAALFTPPLPIQLAN